jgi:hypothetical protein
MRDPGVEIEREGEGKFEGERERKRGRETERGRDRDTERGVSLEGRCQGLITPSKDKVPNDLTSSH